MENPMMQFEVSRPMRAWIEAAASEEGINPEEFLRRLVAKAMKSDEESFIPRKPPEPTTATPLMPDGSLTVARYLDPEAARTPARIVRRTSRKAAKIAQASQAEPKGKKGKKSAVAKAVKPEPARARKAATPPPEPIPEVKRPRVTKAKKAAKKPAPARKIKNL